MQQELGGLWQGIDPHNRLPKCSNDVHIGRFIEADVTVTDLGKVQFCRSDRVSVICFLAQHRGGQQSSVDGPNDAGAGPGHTFEKSSPVNAVVVRIRFDEI